MSASAAADCVYLCTAFQRVKSQAPLAVFRLQSAQEDVLASIMCVFCHALLTNACYSVRFHLDTSVPLRIRILPWSVNKETSYLDWNAPFWFDDVLPHGDLVTIRFVSSPYTQGKHSTPFACVLYCHSMGGGSLCQVSLGLWEVRLLYDRASGIVKVPDSGAAITILSRENEVKQYLLVQQALAWCLAHWQNPPEIQCKLNYNETRHNSILQYQEEHFHHAVLTAIERKDKHLIVCNSNCPIEALIYFFHVLYMSSSQYQSAARSAAVNVDHMLYYFPASALPILRHYPLDQAVTQLTRANFDVENVVKPKDVSLLLHSTLHPMSILPRLHFLMPEPCSFQDEKEICVVHHLSESWNTLQWARQHIKHPNDGVVLWRHRKTSSDPSSPPTFSTLQAFWFVLFTCSNQVKCIALQDESWMLLGSSLLLDNFDMEEYISQAICINL